MQHNDMTVIYLCNAIDELTIKERNFHYFNPAGTNKVIGVGKALRTQDVKVFILSLGRERQNGEGTKFPAIVRRVTGIPILYAAFLNYPFLTHLIGALSLSALLIRLLRNRSGRVVVIAYNRLWHYLPSLVLAALFRKHCYLDLEDGIIDSKNYFTRAVNLISRKLFDFLCNKGALVAAKSLMEELRTERVFICYGCTRTTVGTLAKWDKKPIQILFGGALFVETGVQLLMDSIDILAQHHPYLKDQLKISVSGEGPMVEQLVKFADTKGKGWINYLGNVSRDVYNSLIDHSHIGLSLKMPSTEMGRTTFPSKIIEYASYGLLIISTKVSDVPDLLDDDCAILLPDETPESLVKAILKCVNIRHEAERLANRGQQRVHSLCNYETVGQGMKNFLSSGYVESESQ